jgi:hypothetical protein
MLTGTRQEGIMTDHIRKDESVGRDDPQDSSALPGDPREAQEPQEPRSTHIGTPGRDDATRYEVGQDDTTDDVDEERGVVDQLKEAWDRMRGK